MNIKRYLFVIAFGLISFVSLLFILSTILLALRMQINGFIFPVSFLISLIFEFVICFSWSRKESLIKSSMLVVIVTSFVVFVSVFISSKTYDISFDGMDYQQRAVINLDSGWNPFYEKIQTSDLRSDSFLNSYPKASWYVYSSAYNLFSNIETAKFINILILPLAFIFSLYFLLLFKSLPLWIKILFSILIALNPVFIYQANTLYIDSQVGLFVLLWLLSLAASFLEDDKIIIRVLPFLQILILIYSVNIKFTCSAYIFFLTVSFVLAVLILYIRRKNYSEILRKLYPIIIGGVLGVFVFGYNPYISNTINYDNPFYPVYGSTAYNSEYLIENQMPDNFHDKNSIEKLFLSIFSVTENKFKGSSSALKFPFEVSLKEFKGMSQPDMRIGGFGPVFGLMILISFCSFLVAIFFVIKKRKLDKEAIVLIIVLFANNLSIFINPESWWARYTPQMWLNPILFILLSLLISKNEVIKFLRNLFLVFITVNIICILAVNILSVYRKRIEINTILNDYKQKDKLLYVFPSIFESGLLKLERYGINYTVVEDASSLYKPINFVGMQVSSELNK